MRSFLVTAAIMLLAIPASAQQDPCQKGCWNFVLGDVNFYPGMIETVSNVPAEYRAVPTHPDDGSKRVIKFDDKNLHPGKMWSWTLGFGKMRSTDNNSLALNGTFTLVAGPKPRGSNNPNGTMQAVNYAAGGGAALVYYGVEAHTRYLPGVDVEYKHRVGGVIWLVTGYRFTPYRMYVENGWDRYSSIEINKSDVVSNNYLHEPYFGIAYGVLNFTAGPVFQQVSNTQVGDQMLVHYRSHIWKAGVSFNIPF
jgi:hypothetical protein